MSTGRIIYEPTGAALEYAPLAANLFRGLCPHMCAYNGKHCYANAMWARFHPAEADLPLTLKPNVLERLTKDAERLAGDSRLIHLMFAADCYPVGRPDLWEVTRAALTILRDNELHWQMLTKGGLPACEDGDLYREGDWFGVTWTCDGDYARLWEPNAAPPAARALSLKSAHERGIATWVSCEPVVDPQAVLWFIREYAEVVDLWKIGKWMYNRKQAKLIDWNQFGRDLAEVLTDTGARYLVKKSLARHMPDGFPLTTETDVQEEV